MNSFTVTIDRTLDELTDAYRSFYGLKKDEKVIKRDIGKLIAALVEADIDAITSTIEDDASIDTNND